jgi:hypothetical protein
MLYVVVATSDHKVRSAVGPFESESQAFLWRDAHETTDLELTVVPLTTELVAFNTTSHSLLESEPRRIVADSFENK